MATVGKAALLVVLTLMAYAPLRSAGYVWEDAVYASMPDVVTHGQRLRVSTIASRVVDYRLGDGEPWAAHAVSVAIHLVNGMLVGVLARRLAGPVAGWAAAAVFLVHPLNSEAVSYVTGRSDLLLTTAALGIAVVWRASMTAWRWGAVLVLMALGVTTKEAGVAVLLLPLLLGRSWMALGAIVAGSGLALWRLSGVWDTVPLASWEFIGRQVTAVSTYAAIWLVPVGLSIDHDFEMVPAFTAWLCVALAVGVFWATWRVRGLFPVWAFGMGWIAVTVLPRLVVRSPEFLNERQFYLSAVGLALMTGATAAWTQREGLTT